MTTANTKNNVSRIKRLPLIGFWINAVLVVLKLFFGYWGHSDALVADGYHSISDFITDFIVLVFISIAYKKADSDHPYGHGKFETIASVLIGVILFGIAIYIGYEAIKTIILCIGGKILPRPDVWTIAVALIAIIAKEYCYRITVRTGKKIDSASLVANAWHHRSDALSSIATLIGVSVSYFMGEQWRIMDPIVAVFISIFIIMASVKIATPSIKELLEVSLPEKQVNAIKEIISNVKGVERVHNLRTRRNGHSYIIDVNVHVDPNITVKEAHKIANTVENDIHNNFEKDAIIYVHIEPE
ncbi:MAG: cation diffusion facilitator family transporter [Muribaculaceae bacterium]|nr:cation diffusion facilitator family transporter [Muribaculaceae bacterium]